MTDGERTEDTRDQGMLDRVGGTVRTKREPDAGRQWCLYGHRKEPEPSYTGLYEGPGDYAGVCCSGGGIRSAAFNLGALQVVLGDKDTREDIRYLSAVSGGSYIASAFCMIAKRWSGSRNNIDSDPQLVTDKAPPFEPGSPEEQYLRNHLGYLAPDSTAKLYLALRMIAGLLTNVLLVGLPVLILGIVIGLAADGPYKQIEDGTFDLPWGPLIVVLVAAGLSLALAMADVVLRFHKPTRQRFVRTWQVRVFLIACGLFAVLIAIPWLAAWGAGLDDSRTDAGAGGIWGSIVAAASSVGALAVAAVAEVRGRIKDKQKELAAVETKLGKFATRVRGALIALVVMLAGPILLLAVAVLGVLIAAEKAGAGWIVLGIAGAILFALWVLVDLTTLSLHPFYRGRLATAFALRRVWEDASGVEQPAPSKAKERAKGHTVARERPFEELVELSDTRVECSDSLTSWPMLIVCAAANVSDPGATPPGRAVASFTFSPTAIGGPLTGATKTRRYENLSRNRRRDLTLPAAVAMSGAALSPSMGKMTYRPLTFLLALANIRLGVWVPNPRHVNEECAKTPGDEIESLAPGGRDQRNFRHRPRAHYLWREIFGRNRLDDKFLYVTDGGHYENLGLVELLRRGCRTIYCFDAGGGKTSSALRDAIALARTELNVEIEMDPHTKLLEESKKPPPRSKAVCARGTIKYPGDKTPGHLFYVRSLVAEDSPWDLANYQEDGVFPHHSTFDQFFDDQKFEAYRRLGMWAARGAVGMAGGTTDGAPLVTQLAPTYSASGKLKLELEPDEV